MRDDCHGQHERANFDRRKHQVHGMWTDESAENHQDRRDEQRDLDAAADRDANAEVHAVFQSRAYGGGTAESRR